MGRRLSLSESDKAVLVALLGAGVSREVACGYVGVCVETLRREEGRDVTLRRRVKLASVLFARSVEGVLGDRRAVGVSSFELAYVLGRASRGATRGDRRAAAVAFAELASSGRGGQAWWVLQEFGAWLDTVLPPGRERSVASFAAADFAHYAVTGRLPSHEVLFDRGEPWLTATPGRSLRERKSAAPRG
jgi:hypothetical protein